MQSHIEDTQHPSNTPISALERLLQRRGTWIALFCVLLTAALLFFFGPSVRAYVFNDTLRGYYHFVVVRYAILSLGCFVASYAFLRGSEGRIRWPDREWTPMGTVLLLLGVNVFVLLFTVHYGRHQFGAFDFNAMLEVGWRQFLGQRPYIDFLTPTPPGFNLSILYAMRLFGPTWDATLYLSALFSCVTLLWLYGLFRCLGVRPLIAAFVALTLQAETMLLLCFWWYNSTTLLLAAIFLLSCVAYARRAESVAVQLSYVGSFVLLALMKPNIAGITIFPCFAFLLLFTGKHLRLLLLSVGALVLLAVVFWMGHVSLPGMIATYRAMARERGGLSLFGLKQMDTPLLAMTATGFAVSLVMVICLSPDALALLRQRSWQVALRYGFVLCALIISVYGVMTNGEFPQVEMAPLTAALAAVVFSTPTSKRWLRSFLLSFLLADMAGNLYLGAERVRVYTIGPGMFFESANNQNPIADGPLRHMRVSQTMIDVQTQIQQALASNPGPYYFGPRVDYSYFARSLPSHKGLPAWWHPGTSFGRDQEHALIQSWSQDGFNTLIFLKDEHQYYSPEFLDAIHRQYIEDDSYSKLTIYHRRPVIAMQGR